MQDSVAVLMLGEMPVVYQTGETYSISLWAALVCVMGFALVFGVFTSIWD